MLLLFIRDGVQTDWWSGKCEPQRVIARYFGVPLHCLLYNGGDMPITVQGGYGTHSSRRRRKQQTVLTCFVVAAGLIKFAVALNYTTQYVGVHELYCTQLTCTSPTTPPPVMMAPNS